ncbi:secretin N-terminal domain-containing protein [Rheinheimera maricola]|uniref:Type II secretion system protein GspD n=1 Tax=Rheinheimera maricola TaxID=2793282 RepID=A0ABS7X415_9GAMM|nr:secretin N-terminal domain-containing protein [Rheinheimera maricola]MBZ9610291.1 hypothetical protein [Rheinheimera maricola]
MKNISKKKTTMHLAMLVMLSSCASTTEPVDKDRYSDRFKIDSSFLRTEQQDNRGQQQDDADTISDARTTETQIRSMAVLENGSPLLIEPPRFVNNTPISIAINEMAVPQLAHYVFGEILKLDYILSADVERMQERVALNIQSELAPQQLYQVVAEVLSRQGIELYSKDNIIFLNKKSGRSANRSVGIGSRLEDMPSSGDDIIQLVPYTFNSARNIMSIAGKLSNATLTPDNSNRLLMVEGSRNDVERVLQIVEMMDVPHARGRDIRLFSMVYLSPDEMITEINKLMAAEGINITEDVLLVPLMRLNSVVVFATNTTLGNRVAMWAKTLDVATGGEKERYYVYRPSFAKAEELAGSIAKLTNASNEKTTASSEGKGFKISDDKSQNAIIIHATPSKYQEVLTLLRQLDRLPGQVAMQVVIAEVELGDNMSRGIDWFYNSANNANGSAVMELNSGTGLFSFSGIKGDWRVALRMLESQTDIRVLSRPYLVVRDGESASINSGQQVPIITETSSNDNSPDTVRNQVQYRSTGVSLSVTPIINADGLVSLQISQETSKSEPNTTSNISSPTISTRSLSTSILAGSGQTVILGGLIKEDFNDTESSVPLLGKLPLLGHLFRSKGKSFSRTELMVLITPRIVTQTNELEEFGRKLSELYTIPSPYQSN